MIGTKPPGFRQRRQPRRHNTIGINAFKGYTATPVAATGPGDTLKESASDSVTVSKTINALLLTNTAADKLNRLRSISSVTLSRGKWGDRYQHAWVADRPVSISVHPTFSGVVSVQGSVSFGSAEGIIYGDATAATNVNTTLIGTGGLTLAGSNTTTLNVGNDSLLTGGINMATPAGGAFVTESAGNLGANSVTFTGGSFNPALALTISNPINLNGLVTFAGTASFYTGPDNLASNSFITATAATTLNGVVSGSGMLTGLAGTVSLNNNNTFTGVAPLAGGILMVGNKSAVGSGTLTLTGGTLEANVAVTLNNPLTLSNGSTTIASAASQGNNITFSSTTTLAGSNTLTISSGGTTNFSGLVTGPGNAYHPARGQQPGPRDGGGSAIRFVQ